MAGQKRSKGPFFGLVVFIVLVAAVVLILGATIPEDLNRLLNWVFSNH